MTMHRINLPESLRARVGTGVEQEPADRMETPEQVAERHAVAAQHRLTRWLRRLPERYHEARLDALADNQSPEALDLWASSDGLTLVLVGAPGIGKTYAAYAIGNRLVREGVWCECWTATGLMIDLRPDGNRVAAEDAADCDLLVLDDLGRENSSGWTIEQMHHLLDVRVAEGRRTIVTTNLSADQILARYGSAFLDRLVDRASIIRVTGQSRRKAVEW